MGKLVRIDPRAPRKLRQTVYSDRGLRLPERPKRGMGWSDVAGIGAIAAIAFAVTWQAIPTVQLLLLSQHERAAIETSVYYPGCNEVRAQGKAPLYVGQPGYRETMDGDGDGIACEPVY